MRDFRQHRDNEAFTLPVRKPYKYSLTRFMEYLEINRLGKVAFDTGTE